ncbi:hypothetical protein ENSA5_63420 [Enhygromyxa salina]|uniref:DUF434 domain-containing protein n=1 Tax=Enhygromyxa salina TaxID=215803 RepID=A0A2S9XCF3_9BACT|nr:DUF434 domain-containing protein [Enhygromyxa salina]PRP90539.1 hypothetical protein ENSA5_63420 [Enhygromyxa salina]
MGRGPGPDDEALFCDAQLPALRAAVDELAWLLGRGYAETSALALVGDRHGLRARQRAAVRRCTCTDAALAHRRARRVDAAGVAGQALAIDGFNVLITIESALAGGVLLIGRDGSLRDMASVHGSYRRTAQTRAACEAIGDHIAALAPASVLWLLDSPVSNSGRLKVALAELAEDRGWDWGIELDHNPDRRLARFEGVSATADAWILDQARARYDLASAVVADRCPEAWVLDLGALASGLAGAGAPG